MCRGGPVARPWGLEKGGYQMKKIINYNKYPVNPVYPVKNTVLQNKANFFLQICVICEICGFMYLCKTNPISVFSAQKQGLPKKRTQFEPIFAPNLRNLRNLWFRFFKTNPIIRIFNSKSKDAEKTNPFSFYKICVICEICGFKLRNEPKRPRAPRVYNLQSTIYNLQY
jgi:hypothetical protein